MKPLLCAVALAVFLAPARAAYIDSNEAVSAEAQMDGGGCYPIAKHPRVTDQLTLINPEWAAIDVGPHAPPDADPITLHGTVSLAKINEGGDFSGNHLTDDQNTFLDVDPADMAFVATGNVGPKGEEAGQLEFELEIGSYPLFAWAGTGDRMTTVGRWIWDCGHGDPAPEGACSVTTAQACVLDSDCAAPACVACIAGENCIGTVFNYHSELHPPQAVAVSRLGAGHAFSRRRKGGRLATRTDVWLTPNGGGAGDRCVVTHRAHPFDLVTTTECFPLSQPLANVNATDFEFDIPLPPRPAGSRGLPRIKVIDQTPHGLPRARVRTTLVDGTPPHVHAVVDMTSRVRGRLPSMVGKTIFTGWRRDETPVTRLLVHVTAIEILNPLKPVAPAMAEKKRCSVTTTQDCSVTPCPRGEQCLTLGGPIPGWEVFFETNGDWQRLTGLETVMTPGTISEDLGFDTALPASGTLRLHGSGRSLDCREGQLYGTSLRRTLELYGLDDGPKCLQADSHDVGDFEVSFGGPEFGTGGSSLSYVTSSVGGAGGSCSTTMSQLCLGDDDCPSGVTCAVTGGSYRLHYTISRQERAGARTSPGSAGARALFRPPARCARRGPCRSGTRPRSSAWASSPSPRTSAARRR